MRAHGRLPTSLAFSSVLFFQAAFVNESLSPAGTADHGMSLSVLQVPHGEFLLCLLLLIYNLAAFVYESLTPAVAEDHGMSL